jgi:four helix bundle protein
VNSFEEFTLPVGALLQQEILEMSNPFPKEEAYSLTDQIRHSARSLGA